MKATALLVLAVCSVAAATIGPPAAAQNAAACDRECLRSTMTAFLYALLEHDASKVPVAASVRVTEDGVAKELAKVGLMTTVTRPGTPLTGDPEGRCPVAASNDGQGGGPTMPRSVRRPR